MRLEAAVRFCGTMAVKGIMTDVYDTGSGTRLVNGTGLPEEGLTERELSEIVQSDETVVYDWREEPDR